MLVIDERPVTDELKELARLTQGKFGVRPRGRDTGGVPRNVLIKSGRSVIVAEDVGQTSITSRDGTMRLDIVHADSETIWDAGGDLCRQEYEVTPTILDRVTGEDIWALPITTLIVSG